MSQPLQINDFRKSDRLLSLGQPNRREPPL
jgi:hypothetical protein